MKVITTGAVALDILVDSVDHLPYPNTAQRVDALIMSAGGGALTISVLLKRFGIDAFILGEIGHDEPGRIIRKTLSEEAVHQDYLIIRESKRTSTVIVLLNSEKERSFLVPSHCAVGLRHDDFDWEFLTSFDAFLVSSAPLLTQLLPTLPDILKKCQQNGVITLMDTILMPQPYDYDDIVSCLPYLDYFAPSYEEAKAISGLRDATEIGKWCLDKGVKNVIIKKGSEGCLVMNDEICQSLNALKVDLVDSTGAGDCFLAGFVKGIADGYSLIDAAKLATCTAAMGVSQRGAYAGVTSIPFLADYLFE